MADNYEYIMVENLNTVGIEFERVGATMRIRFREDVHPKNLALDANKRSHAILTIKDCVEIQLVEESGIKISIVRKE
jgi:hypothetical protein